MRFLRLYLIVVAASGCSLAAAPDHSSTRPLPRVLRDSEPSDSVVVELAGPPPPPAVTPAPPPPAVAKAVEPTIKLEPPPPAALEDPGRPLLKRAPKPVYPLGFEKDSALYMQKLIGQWTLEDAAMLLGEARGARAAFDDKQKENGTIYAFSDPTGRYRQVELDFDDSGNLRTVFGYPWNLTWQECRRTWGANVNAAEADKGRKFYSYLNRRLDVLVDRGGKVISLGLY